MVAYLKVVVLKKTGDDEIHSLSDSLNLITITIRPSYRQPA